ncbi:MAG TPA: hypothetical protein VI035_05690 [Solirubrobacterales bacterium]
MNLRVSADQAGWSIREAAWGLEERFLWRGGDAARAAFERAGRSTHPLQRLIQTKLTWPLSDAYRARGRKTRGALAASAAAVALAAGGAGAIAAIDHGSGQPAVVVSQVAPVAAVPQASDTLALQGVTPQFEPGHAAVPPTPAAKPTEKPAQVAWEFAVAFVAYEVGQSDKATESTFAATATKSLGKALESDPPRLPANGKVPKARVLNVVLGAANEQQVTASVSLVRMRALSELRLTLTRTGDSWRVAQVLG